MIMKGLASAAWAEHRDSRAIRKAEDFAKFTVASLMVDPLNKTGQTAEVVEYDFQSAGALLVNNLAAKLVMTLFPPGRPGFQLELDDTLKEAAAQAGVDDNTLNSRAADLERRATRRLFMNASLSKLHRATRLLIVTGNALLYRDIVRGRLLVWSLQSYTVRRNAEGDPTMVVLRQQMQWEELSSEIQNDAAAKGVRQGQGVYDLYTTVEWALVPNTTRRRCTVWHELEGKRVGPESSYPEHLCPYIPVAWNLADGEHYGRGYVEEYSGDFARLSLLSERLGLYEFETLNVLNLVDEGSGAIIEDLKDSETGDFIPARVDGVKSYERGDYNKIATANASIIGIVQRLNRAFMYTGQQRDAERVTEAEVRLVAEEAENLLGGAYSLLAENFQAPLAYLALYEASSDDENLLLGVTTRLYRPSIMTGLPALTRNVETQNILRATQEAAAIVPALSQLSQRFDTEKVVERIFANNSVNLAAISKSADQVAAEAQERAALATQQLDTASGAIAAEATQGVLTQ